MAASVTIARLGWSRHRLSPRTQGRVEATRHANSHSRCSEAIYGDPSTFLHCARQNRSDGGQVEDWLKDALTIGQKATRKRQVSGEAAVAGRGHDALPIEKRLQYLKRARQRDSDFDLKLRDGGSRNHIMMRYLECTLKGPHVRYRTPAAAARALNPIDRSFPPRGVDRPT